MRQAYQNLMNKPQQIEAILQQGAAKARAIATPFMAQLREAVGLRDLSTDLRTGQQTYKLVLPVFKQYRQADGLFYFKLQSANGQLLLQSMGFAAAQDAGRAIVNLQQAGLAALSDQNVSIVIADDIEPDAVEHALAQLREAKARAKKSN